MSNWMPWVVGGLILVGLEIFAPGAFMMWVGAAAMITGLIVAVTEIGFGPQGVLFALFSGIAVAIALQLRRPPRRPDPRAAGLVGRLATALSFDGRIGRVRLGDSEWLALVPHDVAPPETGARLRVTDVDGPMLIVRPENG